MSARNASPAPEGDEFAISRLVDAPRDVVWKAYTEIDRLAKWWGPKGFDWIDGSVDLRPGGIFLYGMKTPNGQEMWGKFVYREIVKPERLVFVVSFSDREGGTTRNPWSAEWPLEMLNTVNFIDKGKKTLLDLRSSAVNATAAERRIFREGFASMEAGFGGTLDQLEQHLREG
jgi:uncharacterized protein YndB with AHSA1/START domain